MIIIIFLNIIIIIIIIFFFFFWGGGLSISVNHSIHPVIHNVLLVFVCLLSDYYIWITFQELLMGNIVNLYEK